MIARTLDNIPAEMREKRRWLRWRYDDGRKVPYRCDAAKTASSTDPTTWSTFEHATEAAQRNGMEGIGYAIDAEAGEIVIDLDGCIDENGVCEEWGAEILERFNTYAETSPSGRGVKIFCRGQLLKMDKKSKKSKDPRFAGRDHYEIELFRGDRYLCMTGQKYPGSTDDLRDCQQALDWLWEKYFAEAPKPKPAKRAALPAADDNRLERCHKYVVAMPPAIAGQGGHNATFAVACKCWEFGLDDAQALEVLQQFNARCEPPWSDRELAHKLESARKEVGGNFGSKLLEYRPDDYYGAAPDISAIVQGGEAVAVLDIDPAIPPLSDPPKFDPPAYHIPGFVDELMDFTLSTAPYPNQPLAFCGALTLLSVLVARKVRGPTGLLTNIMALGLANSGSGKDHPRQINGRILQAAGMDDRLSGRIASGQGLEEVVFEQPAHLFQIDEFDSTLIAINRPHDAVGSEIAARLMELYSSAQGVYKMRVKVQKQDEPRRSIVNPHVSVFATCIPSNFYSNLTTKLLSNGLVARLLVVESGERGRGQSVRHRPIPDGIIRTAEHWKDFNPSGGNLGNFTSADPLDIEHDADAAAIFEQALRHAEDQYDACQRNSDNAGCSIWARVLEQAHKLAVLYACSADRHNPYVDGTAAEWATDFAAKHAIWLLSQIGERAGEESKFEQIAKLLIGRLRLRSGKTTRSDCLKATRVKAKEFDEVLNTLRERGEVVANMIDGTQWLAIR